LTLTSLSVEELELFIADKGLPAYRTKQLLYWIYTAGCGDFSEMSNISKSLRTSLAETTVLWSLSLAAHMKSSDGTEKNLFRLEDGEFIESVLMFEGNRRTLCVSTQAGCAMGCKFCLTGSMGLKRNLAAHEIVEQTLFARGRLLPDSDLTNIVLMGMGEPFENFENVREALIRFTSSDYLGISKRRITVSTCGNAAGIRELGRLGPDVNLAVSLNATTDKVRDKIMPINRRFPISKLIAACREFPLNPYRKITFEYVMLDNINDTNEDAKGLLRLLRGIPSKVNLIPFNPYVRSKFKRPADKRVIDFQSLLVDGGIDAPIRKSKGADISAACGQLKNSELRINNSEG